MKRKNSKNKVKKAMMILAFGVLMIVAGLGVMFYPVLTNYLYEKEVKQDKQKFEKYFGISDDDRNNKKSGNDTETMSDSLSDELYRELVKRNEILFKEHQVDLKDPFSYEQPTIELSDYGVPDNTIGYITIPKMDVVLPILLGANNSNMRLGAVHLTQTSYPVGGINTNCVIAAHRGMSKKAMFRNIDLLRPGDVVYIENFKETLIYEVTDIQIISPNEIDKLLIQEGRDMVTLITCHPYRYNYQRYVVFCERVDE